MKRASFRGGRLVGASIPRVEDRTLLLGRGTYVDDVQFSNLVHVAFVRSPLSHARIVAIDVERARRLPGVVGILAGADVATLCPGWRGVLAFPGMKAGLQRPLALDTVRYVGEPVVAVAAESRAIAADAVDLVSVEYDPLPAVVDPIEALKSGAARAARPRRSPTPSTTRSGLSARK